MTRRLRIAHLLIQPVLVWDDGEEITPGPQVEPQQLAVSQVATLLDALPGEVERIAGQVAPIEAPEPPSPGASPSPRSE